MYLHVGKNKNINTADIIGIFDLDHATLSAVTKKFLAKAEHDGKLSLVAEELPRSFVVTAASKHEIYSKKIKSKDHVYLSQLNSQTLAQRSAHVIK